jgi:hypothetical protein
MSNLQVRGLPLWFFAMALLAGCGSPTPTKPNAGPPSPPPVPEPQPVLQPPKPQPDPYETALAEVSTIVKRYGSIYAGINDDATGNKAVEEIGRMTARLRELSAKIGKMPYRADQEKHALALQTDLTQLQTAQLTNADMQRVFGDPDLGLKLVDAHQHFVLEGLLPLGQAVVARQPSAPQPSEPPAAPTDSPALK